MADDHYDIAGTGVGVVEADELLGADRVRAGDVVIAMASSGVHSNGFSLVRHVLLQGARLRLDAVRRGARRRRSARCCSRPTRIYAKDCLALISETEVHAFAHVTGGGLAANLARVLPDGCRRRLDRATWTPPPVFGLVQARGRVEQAEMERTFNMGVGMVAVVAPHDADRALAVLTARHVAGLGARHRRAPATGGAALHGTHPA